MARKSSKASKPSTSAKDPEEEQEKEIVTESDSADTSDKGAGDAQAEVPEEDGEKPVEASAEEESDPIAEITSSTTDAGAGQVPDAADEAEADRGIEEGEDTGGDEGVEDAEILNAEAAQPETTDAETASPEPAPAAISAAEETAAKPAQGSGGMGFFGFLLGGFVAGLIGFAAANYVLTSQPEAEPPAAPEIDTSALESAIEALDAKVSALEGTSAPAMPDIAGPLSGAVGQIEETLGGSLGELTARLETLDSRMGELEQATPEVIVDENALGALRDQLSAELARSADLESQIEALEAEVARLQGLDRNTSAERAAAAQTQIAAALLTGEPFSDALDDWSDATGLDAPQELAAISDTGVVSLAALESGYAAGARAALAAAVRADPGEGAVERAASFLKAQLSVRSVAPREGDSPDAVLSRAEAAMKSGDLAGALEELNALSEDGRAAMAPWIDDATAREAATRALPSLSGAETN
ncbi:MAG: hypothetical protein AAF667_13105 [Pseudomonadota bacterium]